MKVNSDFPIINPARRCMFPQESEWGKPEIFPINTDTMFKKYSVAQFIHNLDLPLYHILNQLGVRIQK
jgi:hypothetical protein